MLSLIFFVGVVLTSCRSKPAHPATVEFEQGRASRIVIDGRAIPGDNGVPSASIGLRLKNNPIAILGDLAQDGNNYVFTPVVPLTAGETYELLVDDLVLDSFVVERQGNGQRPALSKIFPDVDTLPANVLKLYFSFSQAMQEGQALQHIHILDQSGDTIPNLLLDLQPELWNPERNVLTIWFDPGRIKRDLIPNLKAGAPLETGKAYRITVDTAWKSAAGLSLAGPNEKLFVVGPRDSLKPDISQWSILAPIAGGLEVVSIQFNEVLDQFLLQKSFAITDLTGKLVDGSFTVADEGKKLIFRPKRRWEAGKYILRTASILEDLAGNNLNKPFDRDITNTNTPESKDYYERYFEVH